jgi:hypothetical protein
MPTTGTKCGEVPDEPEKFPTSIRRAGQMAQPPPFGRTRRDSRSRGRMIALTGRGTMGLEQVVADLRRRRATIGDDDPRRFFHGAYTRAVSSLLASLDSGMFVDPDWVEDLAETLAGFYLSAFDAHDSGDGVPAPWALALGAGRDPALPPLRMVLIGMNAHVNYDLPRALVAVIDPDDFEDRGLLAHRDLDVRAVDEILASGVTDHDRTLAAMERGTDQPLIDRILRPLNRRGTHVFFTDARSKVWHNAEVLARAVRRNTYEQKLAELEASVTRRLSNLMEPRRMIVDLTRDGFGIELIGDE